MAFDAATDPAYLAWKARRDADAAAGAAHGWARYWDGWPICAVCYVARPATAGSLNTAPERHIADGETCARCGAIHPANSIPREA